MFDYQQISSSLTKELPARTKDVICRRFGLNSKIKAEFASLENCGVKKESLESIGQRYGITRERVRQIEERGISEIKKKNDYYHPILKKLKERLIGFGGFKREDLYLSALGEKEMTNDIAFLLEITDLFFRFSGDKNLHSFWAIDNTDHFNYAKETVSLIEKILKEKGQLFKIEEFKQLVPLVPMARINSSLEIARRIDFNSEGMFGFEDWPEIKPKGSGDKIYLTLKKSGQPLHFREIIKLVGGLVLPQTIHNELIRSQRFVLIGRGVYALREWGYESGDVKKVIREVLLAADRPLSKKEIIKEVLKRRIVKEQTIIQNLSNKKYFKKEPGQGYVVVS